MNNLVAQLHQLLEDGVALETQCEILKNIVPEELTGEDLYQAVEYLYHVSAIPSQTTLAVNIVGTGGDGKGLFNISTTSSFVIAGCGVPVIKHGNIGISSSSGSIDCLKALSVPLPHNLQEVYRQFECHSLSFLFVAHFYPILSRVREARKVLSLSNKYSIFNILGPLLDPLRSRYVLIGVANKTLIPIVSEALLLLGRQGFVFCCQGTDEIIPGEDMYIMQVDANGYHEFIFDCKAYNIAPIDIMALVGQNPVVNAGILLDILKNQEHGAKANVVTLNASFALMIYDNMSFADAHDRACSAIVSSSAYRKLLELV